MCPVYPITNGGLDVTLLRLTHRSTYFEKMLLEILKRGMFLYVTLIIPSSLYAAVIMSLSKSCILNSSRGIPFLQKWNVFSIISLPPTFDKKIKIVFLHKQIMTILYKTLKFLNNTKKMELKSIKITNCVSYIKF